MRFWPWGDDPADILLLTDGEVWDAERIVRAAGEGRKRIFVVGAGTSPASTLLNRIAQATGGAHFAVFVKGQNLRKRKAGTEESACPPSHSIGAG